MYFNELKDNRKAFRNDLNYYYNETILEIDDTDERNANRASILLEKRSSFDWTLLFEVVLLSIIPYPFYDHYFNVSYGEHRFPYSLSEICFIIMFFRFYYLIRAFENFNSYTDAYAKKICRSYQESNGRRFYIKILF